MSIYIISNVCDVLEEVHRKICAGLCTNATACCLETETLRWIEMDRVSIGFGDHLHYRIPGDASDMEDLAGLGWELATVLLDCRVSPVLTRVYLGAGPSFPSSGFC